MKQNVNSRIKTKYIRRLKQAVIGTTMFMAAFYVFKDTVNIQAATEKKQTIMIYMIGSDLESANGMGSLDIQEMMEANPDLDNANVILYTGGCTSWELNIPSDKNATFEMVEDDMTKVSETDEAENTGDAQTFTNFLNYTSENYPAEHYGLILWDHGAGPLLGVGSDENFDGDSLNLLEMKEGFDNSSFNGTDAKLDWIGFDACLMSSIEVANAISPYADYMIASEEVEPGYGWEYNFLNAITKDNITDGDKVGEKIIKAYEKSYTDIFNQYPSLKSDVTLSCIDLSKVADVETAMDNFFSQAEGYLTQGGYNKLAQERLSSKCFGKAASADDSFDLVDFTDLVDQMEQMNKDYPKETKALKAALESLVTDYYSNVDNTYGISLYYPLENKTIADYGTQIYQTFDFSSGYTKYIGEFVRNLNGETTTDWNLSNAALSAEVESDDNVNLSFSLTQEQADTYASSNFIIFMSEKDYEKYYVGNEGAGADDAYIPLFIGRNVALNDQNQLNANYGGQQFVAIDQTTGEKVHFCTIWKKSEDGKDYYEITSILNAYPKEGQTVGDSANGNLCFYVDSNTQELVIQGFMPNPTQNEEGLSIPAKGMIEADELTNYESILLASIIRKATYDENGNILPAAQWENASAGTTVVGGNMLLENGLKLQQEKLDQAEGLICQFNVTDLQSNAYSSNLLQIPTAFKKTAEEDLASQISCIDMIGDLFGMKDDSEMAAVDEKTAKNASGNYMIYADEEKSAQVELTPYENLSSANADIGRLSLYMQGSGISANWEMAKHKTAKEEADGWDGYNPYTGSIVNETEVSTMTIAGQESYWKCWVQVPEKDSKRQYAATIYAAIPVNDNYYVKLTMYMKQNAEDYTGDIYYEGQFKEIVSHVVSVK